jgi:1-deoxy-D-xylulose 5-phosphate reductoisomerase
VTNWWYTCRNRLEATSSDNIQSMKNSIRKHPLPFVLQKHSVTSTWMGNERKYLESLEAKKVFQLLGVTKLVIVYDTLIMLHNIFAFSDTVST